jgi:hypothetical protein
MLGSEMWMLKIKDSRKLETEQMGFHRAIAGCKLKEHMCNVKQCRLGGGEKAMKSHVKDNRAIQHRPRRRRCGRPYRRWWDLR